MDQELVARHLLFLLLYFLKCLHQTPSSLRQAPTAVGSLNAAYLHE